MANAGRGRAYVAPRMVTTEEVGERVGECRQKYGWRRSYLALAAKGVEDGMPNCRRGCRGWPAELDPWFNSAEAYFACGLVVDRLGEYLISAPES